MPGWTWKIGLMATALGALMWLLWPSDETPTDGPKLPDGPAIAATLGVDPKPPGPTIPTGRVEPPAPSIPDEPRPGTLAGKVMDTYGNPLTGVKIAILGDEGVIYEVAVGPEGAYLREDDLLLGNRIIVASEERPLSPLMAGEARLLDVVVGETREVVGWVLDLAGDPVAGARVTLRGEQAKATWSSWTDGGGGFRFTHAPETVVRVTADAGELGMSSVRLARTNDERREVTLVLEPTGTLIVNARPGLGEDVIVRAWDAEAHGVDGVYSDDLRQSESHGEVFEDKMMEVLTTSLATFDAARPED